MTRSSFAKNFNMAGEEEDVKNVFIVKNLLFHKNWKIYSFFVVCQPSSSRSLLMSGSAALADLLQGTAW